MIIISIMLLILGLYLLTKGADFLVDGAAAGSKKLGIPSLAIGLTVVAFGTSLPETVVNVYAVIQSNAEIAFGNIIGSNICNILLILGICACIAPLPFKKSTIKIEIPFALLSAFAFFIFSNKKLINATSENCLTKTDGISLLILFGIFLYYTYTMTLKKETEKLEIKNMSLFKIIIMIIGGLTLLCIGGKITVNSAVQIAKQIGISDLFISCTIVAVGTSLPELVTSVVAVTKKQMGIAIGNIVGSNIFNILLVISVSCLINPLNVPPQINYDFAVMFIATIMLLIFALNKRNKLTKKHGIIFLSTYCVYIGYLLFRG